MITQADNLKNLVSSIEQERRRDSNTKFLAITSGKGGVGKSSISANLGYVLSQLGFKVALFDADLGLANLDVILRVPSIKKNLLHVLKGEATLEEIIVKINENLILIPGDSGDEILNYSNDFIFERFLDDLESLSYLDFMIIDTGAGIGKEVQTFLDASDEVIVVTAPEPAAITDAYAMIKVLSEKRDRVFLLLNQVNGEKEANNIFQKINDVAKKNISAPVILQMIGVIKKDSLMEKASKQRFLVTQKYPTSQISLSIKNISKKIATILERKVLDEKEETGIGRFFRKILNKF